MFSTACGKLLEASPVSAVSGGAKSQDSNVYIGDGDNVISNKNSLIWIKTCLDNVVFDLPAMIDSGANPNCISLRCVQASEYLKKLERFPYSGRPIVDANNEPIKPSYVIRCQLSIGCPTITIETEFVVIRHAQ